MKLQVKYTAKSKNKLSTKSKSKSDNKRTNKNKPKISKFYNDTTPFKQSKIEVTLNKLKYNMIEACEVKVVNLAEGQIQLEYSWVELILKMIDTVMANYTKTFMQVMIENNVTHQQFCIDTTYGKYSFNEEEYKAYPIFDSGYYLDAIFNTENIFNAIIGLALSLDIPLTEISLFMVNRETIKNAQDISFDVLEEKEEIVELDNVLKYLKNGVHMTHIQVSELIVPVHRLDVALVVFCSWVANTYGQSKLLEFNQSNNIGIKLKKELDMSIEEYTFTDIPNTDLQIYLSLLKDIKRDKHIVDYINESLNTLKLSKDTVKFKFRYLKHKDEIKEWEID